jgi:hypothetical protein
VTNSTRYGEGSEVPSLGKRKGKTGKANKSGSAMKVFIPYIRGSIDEVST